MTPEEAAHHPRIDVSGEAGIAIDRRLPEAVQTELLAHAPARPLVEHTVWPRNSPARTWSCAATTGSIYGITDVMSPWSAAVAEPGCEALSMNDAVAEEVRAKPVIVRPRDAASLILLRGTRRRPRTAGRPPAWPCPLHARGLRLSGRRGRRGGQPAVAGRDRRRGPAVAPAALRPRRLARDLGRGRRVVVGRKGDAPPPHGDTATERAYAERGVAADFGLLTYVGRAITPSTVFRRFNTRFFVAEGEHVVGDPMSSDELEDVAWHPIGRTPLSPFRDVTQFMLAQAIALARRHRRCRSPAVMHGLRQTPHPRLPRSHPGSLALLSLRDAKRRGSLETSEVADVSCPTHNCHDQPGRAFHRRRDEQELAELRRGRVHDRRLQIRQRRDLVASEDPLHHARDRQEERRGRDHQRDFAAARQHRHRGELAAADPGGRIVQGGPAAGRRQVFHRHPRPTRARRVE